MKIRGCKKTQIAKNAEKYKKSNGLKDKQNDSKQPLWVSHPFAV